VPESSLLEKTRDYPSEPFSGLPGILQTESAGPSHRVDVIVE